MITLRSYSNVGEAGFAQSLLEAAGIPAVLEDEAAAVFTPGGAAAVRLQVPPERVAEAEQILAEHPVHFMQADATPRFGFWRGSILGLLAYLCAFGALRVAGSSVRFSVGVLIIVWFIGGAIGANYRLRKAAANGTNKA